MVVLKWNNMDVKLIRLEPKSNCIQIPFLNSEGGGGNIFS